jgi:DNA-directed RNA polymerase specialized sigma24 family protein
LTQSRIAELLGMPEGTVKVRLHRARRALAKGMGER